MEFKQFPLDGLLRIIPLCSIPPLQEISFLKNALLTNLRVYDCKANFSSQLRTIIIV